MHPVLGLTIRELLAECTDPLPVKKIFPDDSSKKDHP
jgi:hypothetical protein